MLFDDVFYNMFDDVFSDVFNYVFYDVLNYVFICVYDVFCILYECSKMLPAPGVWNHPSNDFCCQQKLQ